MPLPTGCDRRTKHVPFGRRGEWSVLLRPAGRSHLAVLCVIMLASAFGYVLLEPRRVRVEADGREFIIETNMADDEALIGRAGVELAEGDRITSLRGRGADVLRVDRARSVVVQADGVEYRLRTHARTVEQALAEAGVALEDRDSVLLDGALAPSNAPLDQRSLARTRATAAYAEVSISVQRSVAFTVSEDGREVLTTSSRPSIAAALREAGVIVGPGDRVSPAFERRLEDGMIIDVRHAKAVTVALPEGHRVVYTLELNVGDALHAAGIVVPDGAFVEPGPEATVTPGMTVRMVQLSASSDQEREFIESSTVYRQDPSLAPGETRTVQGRDGVRVRRYEIGYVNGEEATRTLVEEYFEVEPEDTVVFFPPSTASAEPPGSISRTLRVYATYYTPASSGRSPNDPSYGRTATGAVVTYGIVAVDPDVIPLGTRMYIPGYGYAVAADTGGAVKGYIIDLGYPDGVAIDWRSGWIEIYILE